MSKSGFTAPSERRLMDELGVDRETAKQIRGLIRGEIEPESIERVRQYSDSCYHIPGFLTLTLEALNVILQGHGIEAIRGRYVDRYWDDIQFEYVNMGDTYIPTIGYDTERKRFVLTTWGDFVEHNRRRFADAA